jgi:hypothetical protein
MTDDVERFVRRVAADPFDLDNKAGALAALRTMRAERDRLREALETILADRCSNDFGLNPCQDIARAALAKEDG